MSSSDACMVNADGVLLPIMGARLLAFKSVTLPRTWVDAPAETAEGASGTPAEWSDAVLACELQKCSAIAAEIVWRRYAPLVRRLLARSLGPERDVEDNVQDVFLCLFRKVPELRDPGALRSFIVSITMRTMKREVRRRKVRSWLRLDDDGAVADKRSVYTDTDAREALARFYTLLNRVATRERAVFVLHVIEGMDYDAVAHALQISAPMVRRCLTRARERITLLAGRDPLLADYLAKFHLGGKS
jgi:RNA polymerase sigma-70 factor, ECF subfamily